MKKRLSEVSKSRFILGGIISIVILIGVFIFSNPTLLNNLFGASFSSVTTYHAENGLETETGRVEGTSLILEYGDKQTGPNTNMTPGRYYIEYQGDNFDMEFITLLIEGNEIDLSDITITNDRIGLEIDIEAIEPVTFELINNGYEPITIDRIVVSRFINQNLVNNEPEIEEEVIINNNEQEQNEEVANEELTPTGEILTFYTNQLTFQGNAIRTEKSLTLTPGDAQLGPSVAINEGTWQVTYHGENLRLSDILSVYQFEPYMTFTIRNIEATGSTLTFVVTIYQDVASLELLYMNIGNNNVTINKITLERLD